MYFARIQSNNNNAEQNVPPTQLSLSSVSIVSTEALAFSSFTANATTHNNQFSFRNPQLTLRHTI